MQRGPLGYIDGLWELGEYPRRLFEIAYDNVYPDLLPAVDKAASLTDKAINSPEREVAPRVLQRLSDIALEVQRSLIDGPRRVPCRSAEILEAEVDALTALFYTPGQRRAVN